MCLAPTGMADRWGNPSAIENPQGLLQQNYGYHGHEDSIITLFLLSRIQGPDAETLGVVYLRHIHRQELLVKNLFNLPVGVAKLIEPGIRCS